MVIATHTKRLRMQRVSELRFSATLVQEPEIELKLV